MGDASKAALAGFVAGGLIGGLLCGVGHGVLRTDLVLAGAVALLMLLQRRRAATAANSIARSTACSRRHSRQTWPSRYLSPGRSPKGMPMHR